MTERDELPLFAHAQLAGEIARAARDRAARLRRRCASTGGGIGLLAITIIVPPAPRLVWNASASAPVGLYAVLPGASISRGDTVIAWAPHAARGLAARRHYLPGNVPLVKRVRAISGDRICAVGPAILVNRRHVADRLTHDAAGRAMPWWRGCIALREGAVFLMTDPLASFDGRYFGATRADQIIGKAVPLWVR